MSVSRSRSVLANATKRARRDGVDPAAAPHVLRARKDLAEAKINAYIRRTLAEAPPLSPDQIARLQALLGGAQAKGSSTAGPPKAYLPWTDEADHELAEKVVAGWTLGALATHFGRTRGSISSRVERLKLRGLIPGAPSADHE